MGGLVVVVVEVEDMVGGVCDGLLMVTDEVGEV